MTTNPGAAYVAQGKVEMSTINVPRLPTALTVRVARKRVEAQDICSFELIAAQGDTLPAFTAGSHVDVHVGQGIVRQYSLCNDAEERHRYVIGVLKDPASRGGSRAMHESVREGDLLQISEPRNRFTLDESAGKTLLFAGGIGVTPLLCMAERLTHLGAEFELHYCTRTRARTAFIERIERSAFAASVRLHHDDAAPTQKLELDSLLADPDPHTHLYVCGPGGFMNAVLSTARSKEWPEAQLHSEFFTADVARSEIDAAFDVVLASSGRVVRVAAEQTVVQALSAAGVDIPTSCEQGVCGTCLTRVIEGQPDHRDMYLTAQEQASNDHFLPCCSRSRSARLVIDL